MAANGDIYQVVDTSTYQGQKTINVYFYRRDSVVAVVDAEDVADAFINDFLPSVLDCQVPEVIHTEIKVTNLFDDSDKIVVGISEPGTGSGAGTDVLPIFNAVGFVLNQDNGAVRSGAKRYAGLQEASQVSGVITSSGFITVLTALAAALADPLAVGVVDTLFPVIVKRILSGGNYILPDNAGDAVFGGVTDAVFNALITSQNSRKIGRGE